MSYPDPPKSDSFGAQQYGTQPYGAQQQYGTQPYGADPYAPNPYPAAGAQPQPYGTPEPPSPNAGWAVATLVFFWPLAFIAFSRAFSVYPLWAQGRYAEAEAASASVKRLGKISLIIIGALIALYIVAVIILVIVDVSTDPAY